MTETKSKCQVEQIQRIEEYSCQIKSKASPTRNKETAEVIDPDIVADRSKRLQTSCVLKKGKRLRMNECWTESSSD